MYIHLHSLWSTSQDTPAAVLIQYPVNPSTPLDKNSLCATGVYRSTDDKCRCKSNSHYSSSKVGLLYYDHNRSSVLVYDTRTEEQSTGKKHLYIIIIEFEVEKSRKSKTKSLHLGNACTNIGI